MSRYTELTDHVFHQILHYNGEDDDMKKVSDMKKVNAIIHISKLSIVYKLISHLIVSGAANEYTEKKNIQVYWTGKSKQRGM